MELTVKKKAIGLICLLAVVCMLVALIAVASALGAEDKPTVAAAETGFPVPNCAPTDGGAKHNEIFGADSYANHSHDGATALTPEYLTSCNHTLSTGNYYLTSNLKYEGVVVRTGKNQRVTICLNGFMLAVTGDGAPVVIGNGSGIYVVDHEWMEKDDKDHHYTVDETGKYVFSETQAAINGDRYIRGGVITGGGGLSGGGIIIDLESSGSVSMFGGTVAGNNSPYGAIYANYVEMHGGMVAGNVIDSANYVNSAVTILADGEFKLTNGIITDNVGGGVGGAIDGSFILESKPIVTGNRLKDETPRNIYVQKNTRFLILEMTDMQTRIGLYMERTGSVSSYFADFNPGKTLQDFFESDNPNMDFKISESGDAYAYATDNVWVNTECKASMPYGIAGFNATNVDLYFKYPKPKYGMIRVEYYTDEALTQKYPGELYDSVSDEYDNKFPSATMPAGTYYLKIFTVPSDMHNSIEPLAYNKETSPQYVCTITPRQLTVKANDLTSEYGESLKNLTYSITEGTVVNNDKLNIALTKAEGITAKEYAITGEYNNPNYAVTITPGTYTITQKPVGVTIDNKTSVYGEELAGLSFTLNEGSTLAYNETNDDLNITLTKAGSTDAGEYAITGECGNGNYNVTFTDGKYTITQAPNEWLAPLTMSGWTYGATAGEPSATPKFGEVIYTYSDSATGTFIVAKPTNAGTYYVKAEVADTNNYAGLTSDAVAFTIAKATYDMSGAGWDYTTAFTYDGSAKKVEVTGLPTGVTVATYTNNTGTNAGDYTASATLSYDETNYNAPAIDALNWTIDKADYDMTGVTFTDVTVTYDGQAHTITIAGTLPTGADNIQVSVTYAGGATNVGDDGTVTATFATTSDNYNTPAPMTAKVSVTPKTLTVTWSDTSFTYDGTEHKPTASVETGIEGVT